MRKPGGFRGRPLLSVQRPPAALTLADGLWLSNTLTLDLLLWFGQLALESSVVMLEPCLHAATSPRLSCSLPGLSSHPPLSDYQDGFLSGVFSSPFVPPEIILHMAEQMTQQRHQSYNPLLCSKSFSLRVKIEGFTLSDKAL